MNERERKIIQTLSDLKHRTFPRAFERLAVEGEKLIGAEIGVYKGEHAQSLLENLDIEKLFLIDPYTLYQEYDEGKRHYGVDQDPLDLAEKEAERRLEGFVDKTISIKGKSSEVLDQIPGDLDFVYIDGNHQYEFIKNDLENYYQKLKIGGALGGHDMYNGFCEEHNGVVRAVTEFTVKNKLQLHVELPDWWVIKGKLVGEN